MKIHQHFIINFTIIFLATLLLSGIVSYFAIKEININQHKNSLLSEINIIKIQLSKVKDLNEFALHVKENTKHRLTLINKNGRVIAESDFKANKMDNHKYRKEIIMAKAKNSGYNIRTSKTLKKDFLYVATKYKLNNKPIFIRLSMELKSVLNDFYNMWTKVTLIFGVCIFFALYIVSSLNKKINKEILTITNALTNISNKNYQTIQANSFTQEFSTIKRTINKLSSKLQKREHQKRKYTAKIKLISKQRSDIISAISHEFKNPIASVMGYTQTLLDDSSANINIRERFLEKILKNSKKISYMIDRLSLAIKFENGDFKPKLKEFDLSEMTKDIINDFKVSKPNRIFEFKGDHSFTIKADATMIEMVITNLIENALKYSQDEIIIEIKNNTLHVKDFGIGIAKGEIEKVTNKFYRSNTMSWDNSIGLGLALVKYILNLHKSELNIESELGKGSDFYFKIQECKNL